MEERVLNTIHNASGGNNAALSELFDSQESIRSVSGSGNNWAHGHIGYGTEYGDAIMESVRNQAELSDSLQAFFLMHSLGGGTGSGLGTRVTQMLSDEFPDVYRFTTAVFPSLVNDDVVTSPYNAILSLDQLAQYSDAVLALDNQALINICNRHTQQQSKGANAAAVPLYDASSVVHDPSIAHPFASMNQLCGHVLTSLTCSMRFTGSLNVDLNEISMNLVPFPRLHFLIPHLSPMTKILQHHDTMQSESQQGKTSTNAAQRRLQHQHVSSAVATKSIDSMYKDVSSSHTCLLNANPSSHTYLSCGLFSRGSLTITDVNRNLSQLRKTQQMLSWNSEGYKIGLCSVPIDAQHVPYSVLSLVNNTAISENMKQLYDKFSILYRRRAHLHHYEEFIQQEEIGQAGEAVNELCMDYKACELDQHDEIQEIDDNTIQD
jgi:tubulin epsilon